MPAFSEKPESFKGDEGRIFFSFIRYLTWNYPPPSNSHHQDHSIFCREYLKTFICDCYWVTMRWLWAYFHPPTGRRRNLSAPLRPWFHWISFIFSYTCVHTHTYACRCFACWFTSLVFSSRFGWWKALPVSPAKSSKVQTCDCYWVVVDRRLYDFVWCQASKPGQAALQVLS